MLTDDRESTMAQNKKQKQKAPGARVRVRMRIKCVSLSLVRLRDVVSSLSSTRRRRMLTHLRSAARLQWRFAIVLCARTKPATKRRRLHRQPPPFHQTNSHGRPTAKPDVPCLKHVTAWKQRKRSCRNGPPHHPLRIPEVRSRLFPSDRDEGIENGHGDDRREDEQPRRRLTRRAHWGRDMTKEGTCS
jgi:hypothetical protein